MLVILSPANPELAAFSIVCVVAVQRWAGSPAELSTTFGRDSADLLQFVKPGFIRAVQDAPVENLKPPALPGGAKAQIGG